ncbi:MAG: hypothetical protein AAF989_03050 [Planctomycetota bacterium]
MDLLGATLAPAGALAAVDGIIALTWGGVTGFLVVSVLCSVAPVSAKSVLLSILATLSLSETVGVTADFVHAT